jgi:hypothetical protein
MGFEIVRVPAEDDTAAANHGFALCEKCLQLTAPSVVVDDKRPLDTTSEQRGAHFGNFPPHLNLKFIPDPCLTVFLPNS